MNMFDISVENWYTIVIKFNWISIIILLLLIIVFAFIIKKINKFINKKSIEFSGVDIGLGNSKVSMTINKKDQEIAYKIWVELSTRNIHAFDEENDVIIEIYNSWYQLFCNTRVMLEEIPASRIIYSKELIDLVNNMLNNGLRPHLSKWQARYRNWYKVHISELENMTPQDYQKKFPDYQELLKDLTVTNNLMISYKNLMYDIAFK